MLQVITVPFGNNLTFCCKASGKERAQLNTVPTLTSRKRRKEDASPAHALGKQQGPQYQQVSSAYVSPEQSPAGLQPDHACDASLQSLPGTGLGLPPTIEHNTAPQQGAQADREGKLYPASALHIHMGEELNKEGSTCLSFLVWCHVCTWAEECNLTGLHRTALKLVLNAL